MLAGTRNRPIVSGADRAWAGAPGLDDGDQLGAVAGGDPGGAGFAYFEVYAVHGAFLLASVR